ncbi:hypothetical protein PR048_021444 [Dryococelus australis]|uniref:Uncharacterized protein n=1 Tax=Dryococelus australis TaxID=614101 RepID=A0ABQ9GY72_9NEOP|nr:hypothetical protein PR048_021444 [Dryococelus australis]
MRVPATMFCEFTTKLKTLGSEVSGRQSTRSSSFVGLVSGASLQVQKVDITEDIGASEHQVSADTEEIVTTDRDSPTLGHDDNEYNDNADLCMNYNDNSYACDDPDTWPPMISNIEEVWFSKGKLLRLVMFTMAIFVGIMELISKYDDVTHEHLAKKQIYLKFVRDLLNLRTLVGKRERQYLVKYCLEIIQVPLADCCEQGYDNDSNMQGHISGVQSRILEKNRICNFFSLRSLSLNRADVNAAKLNHYVLTFFGNIESFYSLFSSSPGRWELLKQDVPLSLQSLSETHWSERLQAVHPIVKLYPSILKVLDLLLEETVTTLSPLARNTVFGLKNYFGSFKGLLMSSFWHNILSATDQKNVIIQSKGTALDVEPQLIKDSLDGMQILQDLWEIILRESKVVAESVGSPLTSLLGGDLTRFASSELIFDLISPILTIDLDNGQLKIKSKLLVSKYPKDLTYADDLNEEILHMKSIHGIMFHSEKDPLKLLNSI